MCQRATDDRVMTTSQHADLLRRAAIGRRVGEALGFTPDERVMLDGYRLDTGKTHGPRQRSNRCGPIVASWLADGLTDSTLPDVPAFALAGPSHGLPTHGPQKPSPWARQNYREAAAIRRALEA